MANPNPNRENLKSFEPGKSGNPGGRAKGSEEVRELTRKLTPRAIEELERIAFNSPSDKVRLDAIQIILERGYGRAPLAAEEEKRNDPGVTVIVRKFGEVVEEDLIDHEQTPGSRY